MTSEMSIRRHEKTVPAMSDPGLVGRQCWMPVHFCLLILFVWAHPCRVWAHSFTGIVTRVIDGDTIIAGTNIVRLAEIDAPEIKQPYGPDAKATLKAMIAGKRITVTYTRRDRYGRILGTVWAGGVNINEYLVRTGHAWRYRYARKTGLIADAERFARDNRLGLWHAGGVV
ncbi:MAG: thermonuclease family protein [Verrucomicrobia bacterium]|nr:thermonuclease family protein [Verrucomicrobiota bacterium]